MRSFKLLSIFLICLLITGLACAQGVGASGDVKGTVTDPSGAIVAGANVTITDVARGIKRTVTTDDTGEYRVPGLAPATYSVSVNKSGFQPEIAKAVVVTLGQTATIDFKMKLSKVSEQIEVTAEAPVVETDKARQSEVISQQTIQDLPINRRDYLTFTLLAPAVSDSTRMASDQDFRVKQTPQSGLSFYGSNGRGNSVTVDGGEANDDAGGVRLNLGQDAVQEFQINRSNYGADLGGASGASINIVSKSGTNDVHGSLFAFFRNDGMDAANPFSISQALQPGEAFNPLAADSSGTHIKDSLSRQQFGGSIGFPITKDKTFLFTSFEGLHADSQNAVPLLTNTAIFRPSDSVFNDQAGIIRGLAALGTTAVPCLTGFPALPASTCAGTLESIFTVDPTSPQGAFLVNQFENNGGLFPYSNRLYQASARFDHQFSDTNQMFLRYSFGHDLEENPDVQSLTGFSRGSSIHAYDHTLLGAWFHQFSVKTQNEARAQWNYSNFDVIPNFPGQTGIDLPGFGNFGSNIFIPSLTIMRRYEFADNFSTIHGKHTLKMGGSFLYRGNHTESDTFFPGRFVFGSLPGGLVSPCFQVPAACGLTTDPLTGATITPATINSLQSLAAPALLLNGGPVPQFYQQGFGDRPGDAVYNYPRPFASVYFQDTWNPKTNLTLNLGVRYEVDGQYGPLATDKNNFAPRVSFAWDPIGDHKTVIRGGYGVFYSPIYGQIGDVAQTLGVVNGNRQIAQVFVPAPQSTAVFNALFPIISTCQTAVAPNVACITPAALGLLGINITHTGPIPPLSVIFSAQPDYRNPYSQQAEFGIERQIGSGMSISLSGIYVHTIGLPVAIDQNALPAPLTTVQLANGATIQVHNWNSNPAISPLGAAPCAGAAILTCFQNPFTLQDNVYSSKASALYEGAILEVNKRFSDHFSLVGSYTLSKAFDTSTDFNSDFGPQDNTNLGGERGLSDFDQRHKLVAYAAIDTGRTGNAFLSNFQLAPIFRYNSGHPFNLLAGADVNGDRHSTNDRPIGAGRNTGLGPDFFSFDMRITRRVKLNEKADLLVMAEGFNLFNRTNFASVNNVVGPSFGLPKSAGGFGSPTFNVSGQLSQFVNQPLAFTSAFPMRQIQLGARVQF